MRYSASEKVEITIPSAGSSHARANRDPEIDVPPDPKFGGVLNIKLDRPKLSAADIKLLETEGQRNNRKSE